MAIPYDLKYINAKLLSLETKEEKLNYLNEYLFSFKKKRAEFHGTDAKRLEYLKVKTKTDYQKYHTAIDNDRPIYFNYNKSDEIIYKRIGFNNIPLLNERLKLEQTIQYIEADILLFEGLIEKVKSEYLKASPPPQTSTEPEQETPKTYIANEYALAYIFDLYASGKQIPVNKREGGYNKKELIQKGFELYQIDKKKDTFYRAVKHVANYDINKQSDLVNISKNWIEAVEALSKDWNKTKKYLKEKKLIGE